MSMLIPNVEELVASNHPYREILSRLDFRELTKPLRKLYSEIGRGGYAIEQGFKCLVLQFMEDLSDREAERMPFENVFSKQSKLARFKGLVKNQFQAVMQAFAFNLKRLVSTASPPIQLIPV